MAKKNQMLEQEEQLSLFENQDNWTPKTNDDSDDDWLHDDDLDFGKAFEPSDRTVETERELLTLKLLRKAIQEPIRFS